MVVGGGGSAKVYENLGNRSWRLTDELVPPATETVSFFGVNAVAMGRIGDATLWCAVSGRQENGEDAVFLYETNVYGYDYVAGGWSFVQKINATSWPVFSSSYYPSRRTPTESFGRSLAAAGEKLVIGAPVVFNAEPGSVYVYSVRGNGVSYRHQLLGETPGFGYAVAAKTPASSP